MASGILKTKLPHCQPLAQRHCPASRFDPTRPFRLLALAAALAWLANRRLCWDLLPVPWDLARPLLVTPSAPPFDESSPLGIHCYQAVLRMVFVLDTYQSFTYNLVQYLG